MDVRRAVAALMLLGLLVSCSDDEPSSDPPDPAGSATVSPSPTETSSRQTAPAIPPIASEATLPGAKAFVRHYLRVVSYAMRTGDSDPMRELSSTSCRACETTRKRVDHVYRVGGRVVTTGWHDELVLEDPSQHLPARRFFVKIRQGRQTLFDVAGHVVDRDPAKTMSMRIRLDREADRWLVGEMELVQ